MINAPVIKSPFGQHYIITTARQAQRRPSLNAKSFVSVVATEHFIENLHTPLGYWQQLALQVQLYPYNAWRAQHPWQSIEKYIAQAITHGAIKVFKTTSQVELNQTTKARRFKTAQGKRYQLLPASASLTAAASDLSNIVTIKEAQQLIAELNIDNNGAKALNESLCITATDNALSPATPVTPYEQLTNAIANGDVIVSLEPEARKPKGDGEFEVQDSPQAVNQAPAPAPSPTPAAKPAAAPIKTDAQKESAAVLEKAAEEGTPFCEDCQDTNKNNTAPTTKPSPAKSAVSKSNVKGEAASAAVLEKAAKEGTPFCEECQKEDDKKAA